jgi:hypothetical protein
MNHAITVGALLLALGLIAGLILCALGCLAVFAGGMSDNPKAGDDAGRTGCILFVAGAVVFGGSLFGLLG